MSPHRRFSTTSDGAICSAQRSPCPHLVRKSVTVRQDLVPQLVGPGHPVSWAEGLKSSETVLVMRSV